jgi:hypothetical protein
VKSTSICPKCDGRKIYEVSPVQQTYCDAQGILRDFHLTGARLPTGEKGLFGGDVTTLEVAGPLEACVCAACGYTEWFMPSQALRALERLLTTGAVRVSKLAIPHEPFR